ncbi:MAG: pilus assembly protein PilP [Burkholderia sp.]|nr:pilus assembly protein PilP [Burkholderia sp.]
MQSKLNIFVALSIAALSNYVFADSTSDSLTRIEAETLLLKAQEKQLEVRSSIIGKQNEIAVKQSMGNLLTQYNVVGDPVVRAIEGVGKSLYATLQLNDGTLVDVQTGDKLSNGMRVVSIRSGEVIVQTKTHQRVRLPGSVPAAGVVSPGYTGPALPMPTSMQVPMPAAVSPRGPAR